MIKTTLWCLIMTPLFGTETHQNSIPGPIQLPTFGSSSGEPTTEDNPARPGTPFNTTPKGVPVVLGSTTNKRTLEKMTDEERAQWHERNPGWERSLDVLYYSPQNP